MKAATLIPHTGRPPSWPECETVSIPSGASRTATFTNRGGIYNNIERMDEVL